MDPKRRNTRFALITAVFITSVSIGLFYLMFYRAAQLGAFTRPLQFISLLSYPGMLPGFVIAGSAKGNFHAGANDLSVILSVAIPIDIMFYFVVTDFLLKAWARLRGRT